MNTNIITCRHLTKSFGNSVILKDINIDIKKGSSTAIIGANGSGKSTLLRCMIRLIEPDKGDINILGKNITGLKKKELKIIRSKVGFIFQKHNLVERVSALTNVLHGALKRTFEPLVWSHSFAPTVLRQEAFSLLAKVGLENKVLERVGNLSGGQSQKVAIARALMQKPEIIFADEPVASLDPSAGEEVMNLLYTLCKENGVTLIFISHHLSHLSAFADQVIGLKKGSIVINQKAKEIDACNLEEFYES